jgi:hypothetical protein
MGPDVGGRTFLARLLLGVCIVRGTRCDTARSLANHLNVTLGGSRVVGTNWALQPRRGHLRHPEVVRYSKPSIGS